MKSLRITKAASVVALSSALVIGGASMASADQSGPGAQIKPATASKSAPSKLSARAAGSKPIDIYGVKVANSTIRNSKTVKSVSFKFKRLGSFGSISITANLHKGNKFIKKINFGGRTGAYFDFWKAYGRGTFRVDHFTIRWTSNGKTHTAVDLNGDNFTAKSGVRAKKSQSPKIRYSYSGSKKKAIVYPMQRFGGSGWKTYHAKVHVQYKKNGHWHTRKTITTKIRGKQTYTFYPNHKRKYRFKLSPTSYTAGPAWTLPYKI